MTVLLPFIVNAGLNFVLGLLIAFFLGPAEFGRYAIGAAIIGGLAFLALAVQVWRSRAGDQPDKADTVGREAALYDVRAEAKPARNLFAFSILYLMALFSALLVEQLPGLGA